MSEYITKADLLQHEKEASERAKVTSDKEQKFRHDLRDQVHEDYLDIWEKVWNNDKDLALLKQSHNTMSENIKEIKEDMKEWFLNIENKMEDFLKELPKHFATKEEHQANSIKIDQITDKQKKWDKWFVWALWILWTALMWAILKLIII